MCLTLRPDCSELEIELREDALLMFLFKFYCLLHPEGCEISLRIRPSGAMHVCFTHTSMHVHTQSITIEPQ